MLAALFYYTLIAMAAFVLAASACLSSFIVSRNKAFAWLFGCFMFYFLDMSTVFFHDFVAQRAAEGGSFWSIENPYLIIATGLGEFSCLAMAGREFFGLRSRVAALAPVAVWAVVSVVVLQIPLDERLHGFAFFLPRTVLLYFGCLFLLVRYASLEAGPAKSVLGKMRLVWLVALVLVTCAAAEDAFFLLLYQPDPSHALQPGFFAERNFCENALFLLVGGVSVVASYNHLRLRYERPVTATGDESIDKMMQITMPVFVSRHGLTPRESEVLGLVLQGKDNQNIASELSLSVSTVKVHMSNIFKKTGCANRKELAQEFWRR